MVKYQTNKVLGNLDESIVVNHIDDKQYDMSKEAIPTKYKKLILLASAIT